MNTKVKICGLRTSGALEAALDAGADYIGLVFYEASPRNVSHADASMLAAMARGKAKPVALLVDPDDDAVKRITDEVNPDLIQLHGSESPERVMQISQLAQTPVMVALGEVPGCGGPMQRILTEQQAARAENLVRQSNMG